MRKWQFILLPFSWIFWMIVFIRNSLFDFGILRSYDIPVPSITVGNLRVGGTGKTPMTIYLCQLLQNHFKTAVISRGYGRKTKGFRMVTEDDLPLLSGDEPLLIRQKLNANATVAVCENRKEGFLQLLKRQPSLDAFVFDDAFQHRKIKSGLSLLLTEFDRPYWEDYLLPAGRLREPSASASRADILIITKSPVNLDENQKNTFISRTGFSSENVFFSSIIYSGLIAKFHSISFIKKIVLITGIDNPLPLQHELEKNAEVKAVTFPNHYSFTTQDITNIHDIFDTFACDETAIVTTSKDFVRLQQADVNHYMKNFPWYVMEIALQLDKQEIFNQRILNYVRGV
jgi:tetraacyldisaccharide 4'-kinase